ncbi:MAG: autotransporter-associated beta strand repeat-containing protein [Verrucomicrobiales bacterium]|jgi:autotransporter-associated beta strand protein/T5SS/PEP-CTERM-associated repeat protein|nr:autotransporter-associated beta strand repeat-containing protein [Verrucomicrobiales bacterium]
MLCVACGTLTVAGEARAQDVWTFSGTGDWFTSADWSLSAVPTSSDAVTIGIHATVIINSGSLAQAGGVTLSGSGSLLVNGELDNTGNAYVGNLSLGTATVSGLWQNTGDMNVGYGHGGQGALTISGTVTSVNGFIGYDPVNSAGIASVGNVNVTGLWQNSGGLMIGSGYSGADLGQLRISGTGLVISSGGTAGYGSNSGGLIMVSGSGRWQNTGGLVLGYNTGEGVMTIANTGIVTTGGDILFGQNTGATGTVGVSGSALWQQTSGNFYMGASGGTSVMGITNSGSVLVAGTSFVGYNSGQSSGAVSVSSQALWQSGGDLVLGYNGAKGTLAISGSGTVIDANGVIGQYGSAMVTLSDHALWINQGSLSLGGSGFSTGGTLSITDSGSVSVGTAFIPAPNNTLILTLTGTRGAFITAQTASLLGGNLELVGFSSSASGTKASEISQNNQVLIHTTGGITGDFSTKTVVAGSNSVDYLTAGGAFISGGTDYVVGTQLTWYSGTATAHGNFTIGAGQSFEMDVALVDQSQLGTFQNGWDGSSLTVTASNSGTLILSASNSYTGTTGVLGGQLLVTGNGAIANSNAAIINGGSATVNGSAWWNATGSFVLGSGALKVMDTGSITADGAYVQTGNGALSLDLGSGTRGAFITAQSATLSGSLTVTNYTGAASGTKASELAANAQVLIHTSSTISGDFSSKTISGGTGMADYLAFGTFIVGGTDYVIGTQLAWYSGTATGNGNFTIGSGSSFEVDVALVDQNQLGTFQSGWDGRSLTVTASNSGTLILSASNTYTGTTSVLGGVLSVTGWTGSNAAGLIGGTSGTANVTVSGSGYWGIVNGGTLQVGQTGAGYLHITDSGSVTVGGAYLQNANSTLVLDLSGSLGSRGAFVTAGTAQLSGTLTVSDTGATAAFVNGGSASALANNAQVLIHTSSTISGDFTSKIVTGGTSARDFLTFGAFIVGGTDYVLGSQLTWYSGTQTAHGNFTLDSGESFTVDVPLSNVATPNASGWDGQSLTVTSSNSGTLILSASNTYTGTTTVNGGVLNITGWTGSNAAGVIDSAGAATEANVTVGGSGYWGMAGNLQVGQSGTAWLHITDSGSVSVGGTMFIDDNAGTVEIGGTSGTATLNVGGDFIVGTAGIGNLLTGSNGVVTVGGNSVIGQSAAATGSAAVTGNGYWSSTDGIMVANNGTGALLLTDSGSIVSGGLTIGNNGTGTVTVSGSALWRVQAGGDFFVGESGNATLIINQSGTVTSAGDMIIGFTGDATGRVTVSDTAWLNVGGNLTVSNGGTASLVVAGSGSVVATAVYQQNANGALALTLTGSLGSRGAFITAADANLDGTLTVNASGTATGTKASELAQDLQVLIHTTGSIDGWFSGVTVNGGTSTADYLTFGAFVAGGTDVVLGTRLTWYSGTATGSGTFTVNNSFDVDVLLANQDQLGTFATGWDGQSLYKAGSGTLVLSASNSFTGSVGVGAGALYVTNANAITNAGALTVDSGAAAYIAPATGGNYTLNNNLSGGGLLEVNLFAASDTLVLSGSSLDFTGTANLRNGVYTLNNSDFNNATVISSSGNLMVVASGSNRTGNFIFNGGTVQFDISGSGPRANGWIDTGALALSSGAVQIDPSLLGVSGSAPLLQQDDGGARIQLINASNVIGSAGNLELLDLSGNSIQNVGFTSAIVQGGGTVATGYYAGAALTQDANGLYVSSGVLTRLDLLTGTTTMFASDTVPPAGGDDMKAQITGGGNLAINATGAITLTNSSNSYSGTTFVNTGTLIAGTNHALGDTALLDLTSVFDLNGKTQVVGALSGSNGSALNLHGGDLTISGSTGNSVSNGVLTGSGALTVQSNTLTVNGTNGGMSASVTIDQPATVALNSVLGIGTGAITDNGLLLIDGASGTLVNQVGGNGTATLDNAAQVTVGGSNGAFSGTWNIADSLASLTAGSTANLGTAQVVINGTFNLNNADDEVLANVLSGTGWFVKDAAGNLAINQANSGFSGTTIINGGTLTLGNLLGTGTGNVINNSVLDLATGGTYGNNVSGSGTNVISGDGVVISGSNTQAAWKVTGSGTMTSQNNLGVSGSTGVNITGGDLSLLFGGTDYQFNQPLTGSNGTLLVQNSGTFGFGSVTGTDYRGAVELQDNQFELSGGNTQALSHATLVIGDNNFTNVGSGTQSIGNLILQSGTMQFTLAGSGSSAEGVVKTGTLNIGNTVLVINTASLGGSTLPLLQQDEGSGIKLVDYTALLGNTQISGTNLVDQNGNQLGNATELGIVQSSATTAIGTYDFAATASGGSLNLAYTLTNLNLLAGQTTVLDNDVANAILHGADELHAAITGSGNLQIDATDSITLNGANTYTGTTFADSGTLIAGVDHALGQTAELAVSGSATVDLNGKTQTIGSLNNDGALDFGGGALTISGSNGNSTSTGALSGSGALPVQSNTLSISGSNGTTVSGTINNGAAIVVNNVAGLGTGSVTDNGLFLFDGAIGTNVNAMSGSGVVSATNAANVVLGGSNSAFSGTWAIADDSNFKAIGVDSLGNGTVADSGTLTLGGTTDYSLLSTNTISGTGMLVKEDANTVTISSSNSYSGGTQINSGTLKLTDLQGTGTGAVLNNGGLDLAAGGTYANSISGAGVNTISGSTVTIGGSNTAFSGSWSVTGAGVATTQDNLGPAAVDIAAGGILSLLPVSGGWSFDNALTGSGTLYAAFSDTTGAFDFTAGSGTGFAGTVELGTGSFNLSGQNAAALANATLQIDGGNYTAVGSGTQSVGNLTYNGGRMDFAVNVPAETQATTFISTNTLTLLSGSVGVNMNNFDHDPAAPTNLNLLDQDNGNPIVQLIAASTVAGGAGNLTLIDTVTGSAIDVSGSTATAVTINEGGTAVATGYYNYGLTTGANGVDDGLYVSYILRELDVYAGQVVTLDNTTAGDTELSAYVTGNGGLDIVAGPQGMITLSGSNDYYGATTVFSGTLRVGNLNGDQIFANSEAMIIHDGATLDLNNQDEIVNNLQGQGTVMTGSAALTANNTTDTAFTGVVDGANGELVKTGSAALDLSNAVAVSLKGVTVRDGDLEMGTTANIAADTDPAVTMQGGTAGFNGSQLSGNGDLIVANNSGSSTLNLSNMHVTATGGDLINIEEGSTLIANVNGSTLVGDITAAGDGTLNLLNNSILTGKIDPLNVNIDNTSAWNMTASSSVLQLSNNGLVNYVTDGSYNKTLTVTGLNGSGTFGMNVNVATNESDFLRINGAARGSFTINIKRSAADQLVVVPQLEIPMVYVQTDGGVNFNGSTDVGMRSAHVQLGDLGGGNLDQWYLVLAPESGGGNTPGEGGLAVLSSAAARELAWFDNNTLTKRMGDLHMDQNGHDWDVWVQSYGSQYNMGGQVTGHTWELMTYGVNIGADKAWNIDKRNTLYTGVFGGYDSGDLDFKQNSGTGSNDAYSLGFYGTWIHDSGWYADWIGKAQYYSNNFKAYDDNRNETSGDYDNWAVGTSLELGRQFRFKDGWFAEPQVQASYVHFFGGSYTTGDDNVFGVNLQDRDVLQFRFGSLLGRNIQLTPNNTSSFLQPYVKIFGVEQVSNGGAVSSGPDSWNPNFDGASAIIGTGLVWQIGPDDQIHLDYEAQFSDKYTKPFGINFGFNHRF